MHSPVKAHVTKSQIYQILHIKINNKISPHVQNTFCDNGDHSAHQATRILVLVKVLSVT